MDTQVTIIMSFLYFSIESFPARCRSLLGIAFLIARDPSLYKVNAPHWESRYKDIEVKRRIWWDIVVPLCIRI